MPCYLISTACSSSSESPGSSCSRVQVRELGRGFVTSTINSGMEGFERGSEGRGGLCLRVSNLWVGVEVLLGPPNVGVDQLKWDRDVRQARTAKT